MTDKAAVHRTDFPEMRQPRTQQLSDGELFLLHRTRHSPDRHTRLEHAHTEGEKSSWRKVEDFLNGVDSPPPSPDLTRRSEGGAKADGLESKGATKARLHAITPRSAWAC